MQNSVNSCFCETEKNVFKVFTLNCPQNIDFDLKWNIFDVNV